jgi:hypothetical protein
MIKLLESLQYHERALQTMMTFTIAKLACITRFAGPGERAFYRSSPQTIEIHYQHKHNGLASFTATSTWICLVYYNVLKNFLKNLMEWELR